MMLPINGLYPDGNHGATEYLFTHKALGHLKRVIFYGKHNPHHGAFGVEIPATFSVQRDLARFRLIEDDLATFWRST